MKTSNKLTQIVGSNYIDTSIQISRKGWTASDNAIIASSEDFPDALGGTSLGITLDCPMFLSSKYTVDTEVLNELKRLNVKKVYILGGEGAISSNVATIISTQGYTIVRLEGKDRYETAVAVGQEIVNQGGTDTVYIANANNFADALSGAVFAGKQKAPILLTDKNNLPDVNKQALSKWGIKNYYVLGGEGVISQSVIDDISVLPTNDDMYTKNHTSRLWGQNRYETSQAIISMFTLSKDNLTVVTGKDYHNALVAAPYASKINMPILLMDDDCSYSNKEYIFDKNLLVIGKSFLTSNVGKITENGLTYTWGSVKANMLAARVTPQFYPETKILPDLTYTTGLDYSTPDSIWDVFDVHSIKNAKQPNMDFKIEMRSIGGFPIVEPPSVWRDMYNAYDAVYTSISPTGHAALRAAIDNTKIRDSEIGNMLSYFPTVLFIDNRRIFVTKYRVGWADDGSYILYYDVCFSAIGDTSNIWEEINQLTNNNEMHYTHKQFKEIMPELASY